MNVQDHFRRCSLLARCIAAAGLCVGAGTALAEPAELGTAPLRISGFGTSGVSQTSAPPGWGFQRESIQPANHGGTRLDTDSRLGLQANYSIDPRFEFVGQLLLKRSLPYAPASDAVSWLFAAWRPTENVAFRAGRLSVNQYQLSDYRSVGLAYPFVRPPTEFYSLLPSAFDGLDLTRTWRDGADATWKLSSYYGQAKQATNRSMGFITIRPLYGVFVSREDEGLLLKASASRTRLASGLSAATPLITALTPLTTLPVTAVANEAAALQRSLLPGTMADYYGLGLSFDRDGWLAMMEASHIRLHDTSRIEAGYILLGRRFGRATPYASISATRTRADTRGPSWVGSLAPVLGATGAAQAQMLGDLAYAASTTGPAQRTWSLGTRWDMSAQTAVKVQYDCSRINARGSLLWPNASDDAANAHVVSATFDFIF